MIASNSSPILVLGRNGNLYLLKLIFKTVLIPQSVYDEILEKRETLEAHALEIAIKEGWITIRKTQVTEILETQKIGKGEKEAIALAVAEKLTLLIDDSLGKAFATIYGVEAHGTLYVIFIALEKGIIKKHQAKEIIENLIATEFYISSDLYSQIMKELQ